MPGTRPERTTGSSRAGFGDVLRIGLHIAAGLVRHDRGFDATAAGCRWARGLADTGATDRSGRAGIRLPVPGRHVELIADHATSHEILAGAPSAAGYTTGRVKRTAMQFLAPHALTIADGEEWARLRAFNEQVLSGGVAHPHAQAFLDAVRAAFDRPVSGSDDIRTCMARAMTRIVLGAGEDDDVIAADVRALFDTVQSPVRRRLLGWRQRARRVRFYDALQRRWHAAHETDPTLIAQARRIGGDADPVVLLQQMPHWMFTFTGSGTDLLARTLVMMTTREAVRRRVLEELASAAPLDRAENIARLPFLNACLLETGRLFPPVTRTFHAAPDGREVVHWFPLLHRDDALATDVHAFRPERWLAAEPDPAAAASNLFLRGPRACPGRDLILFVCAGALARLVGELNIVAHSPRLQRDPVPFTFPARDARFVQEPTPAPLVEARS